MERSKRTFILIRHGETDWNRVGRLQGQRDTSLNNTGRRQARRNGLALADYLVHVDRRPDDFTWFASPLLRTRETMDLVRTSMRLDSGGYVLDDRLKEIRFGDWEGKIPTDLKKTVPKTYRARQADRWNFQPPNGESYAMLKDRILGWLAGTSGDLIVVTHGGVIRVLWHLLEGLPPDVVTHRTVEQERVYVVSDGLACLV